MQFFQEDDEWKVLYFDVTLWTFIEYSRGTDPGINILNPLRLGIFNEGSYTGGWGRTSCVSTEG